MDDRKGTVHTSEPGTLGRFSLLASAVAGRLVDVEPAEPTVPSWTNGATIFVAADAAPAEQLRRVVLQAALVAAGSLEPGVLRRVGRRAAAARRFLALEGHRALAEQEDLLPPVMRRAIDRAVASRTDGPEASIAIAFSREPIAEPPAWFGMLRPRQVLAAAVPAAGDEQAKHAARPNSVAPRELADAEGSGTGEPVIDFLTSPVGGGGPIGKLLQRLAAEARSTGGGPPGGDTPTRTTKRGGRVSRRSAVSSSTMPLSADADVEATRGFTYPEWDANRRQYRPDWCTVIESEPGPDEQRPFVAPDPNALRRQLARLGTGPERRRRQLQGDDLDIDALVESLVEIRSGTAPDENFYIDTLRTRRDLSVLVLLDVSGSAGELSATGTTVHDQQRAAAAALTLALHDLGDRVSLFAFRSMGRSVVQMVAVKQFDATVDARMLSSLGGLVPGAYTRLGAAIRHGASVLDERSGTSRRLLVVLSDGFAYDHGYGGDYGEADARRALAETRRRGIGCVCLSVGAAIDADALGRVFGTAAHARISRVEQMAHVIGPMFRSALKSADMRRRVAQRADRTVERLQIERRTA